MSTPKPALNVPAGCFPGWSKAWAQRGHGLIAALLFCSCLAAGADESRPPNYFPRLWKTENGLPDNAVTAVVQTRDGYLWVGTYGGLVRFDGVRFTVFNSASTPGLQSDRITGLFEDARAPCGSAMNAAI